MPIHWSIHSLPELAHLTRDQRTQIEQKYWRKQFRDWRVLLLFGCHFAILAFVLIMYFSPYLRASKSMLMYLLLLQIGTSTAFNVLLPALRLAALRPYILAHLGKFCTHCLYDLSAHHPGQNCPECGTPIPETTKPSTPLAPVSPALTTRPPNVPPHSLAASRTALPAWSRIRARLPPNRFVIRTSPLVIDH